MWLSNLHSPWHKQMISLYSNMWFRKRIKLWNIASKQRIEKGQVGQPPKLVHKQMSALEVEHDTKTKHVFHIHKYQDV